MTVETRIYAINPIRDARWSRFLENQSMASVFHTPEWLRALQSTYGFEPIAFVNAPPGEELEDGQVFCHVNSWLTGKRLVSVPFSDHAALLARPSMKSFLLQELKERTDREQLRYVEVRPYQDSSLEYAGFHKSDVFFTHAIALERNPATIFGKFHKDCVQRKIRKAEREKLIYTVGRDSGFLEKFYGLLVLTNRRRGTPPQPFAWFRHLVDCLGERLTIRIVSKEGRPIAAILTINYKKVMTYKYGCSDERFHRLGGMPLLFWRSIQEAKLLGMESFDMGRSDVGQAGLIAFKEHFGAERRMLNYWRYPNEAMWTRGSRKFKVAAAIMSIAPSAFLRAVGSFGYRHMG